MSDVWAAIGAGIVGGVAMTLMMALARAMGLIDTVMERHHGCMLTGKSEGGGAYLAGLAMHLVISALVALLYAWAFGSWWGRATWSLGLLGGLVHWAIGGVVLPLMDRANRCVREGRIGGFGAFGADRGAVMVAAFLASHLLYGLIVGWLYGVP